jgi:hypothetical protein
MGVIVLFDTLARQEAGDLAILGTGEQARMHLQAMLEVRRLRGFGSRLWTNVFRWGYPHEIARSNPKMAP